jgi:hypothetical protein
MTVKKRMMEDKNTALSIDRWGPSASLRSAQDDKGGGRNERSG